jgi:hypothetical protein
MRAIANLLFQFILACSVLLCITCNRSEEEESVSTQSVEVGKMDDAFIISQIHNAYALIELAEIAEKKGTTETSSRATALKDSQMAALYLFTDFANQKKIRIPIARENSEARKVYVLTEKFDEEWNKIVTQRTQQTIDHLEDYFLRAEKDSRRVIADVLATLQPETLDKQNKVAGK